VYNGEKNQPSRMDTVRAAQQRATDFSGPAQLQHGLPPREVGTNHMRTALSLKMPERSGKWSLSPGTQDPYFSTVSQNVLDWSILAVLLIRHPGVTLRSRVMDDPLFETTRLGDVLRSRVGIENFLADCRAIPHCGDTTINAIRSVLTAEARQLDVEAAQWPAEEVAAGMAAADGKTQQLYPAPAPLAFGDWEQAVTCAFGCHDVAQGSCPILHIPRAVHEVAKLSELLRSYFARTGRRLELRGTVILPQCLLSDTEARRRADVVKRLAVALPAGVVLREMAVGVTLAPVTCIGDAVMLPVVTGWAMLQQPQLRRDIWAALAVERDTPSAPHPTADDNPRTASAGSAPRVTLE